MSFKKFENTAVAAFDISVDSPMLIADQSMKTDFLLPDMHFLKNSTSKGMVYVIPGSTIKGVIRSYLEDIAHSDEIKELFGCIGDKKLRGKIGFYDAFADMDTIKSSIRNSTAIDPNSGGVVSGSLNDYEVVEEGVFKGSFKLVNYTPYELKLIMEALTAVNDGLISFGHGKTKGFGRAKIENFSVTICKGFDKDFNPNNKIYNSIEELMKGEEVQNV